MNDIVCCFCFTLPYFVSFLVVLAAAVIGGVCIYKRVRRRNSDIDVAPLVRTTSKSGPVYQGLWHSLLAWKETHRESQEGVES